MRQQHRKEKKNHTLVFQSITDIAVRRVILQLFHFIIFFLTKGCVVYFPSEATVYCEFFFTSNDVIFQNIHQS